MQVKITAAEGKACVFENRFVPLGSIAIAKVTEPGAVFGELSALLDQPHTAAVHATETSQFHVADAALLAEDPIVLLYVAGLLARRLDGANLALIELKSQLEAGQARTDTRNRLGASSKAVPVR